MWDYFFQQEKEEEEKKKRRRFLQSLLSIDIVLLRIAVYIEENE